MPRGIWKNRPRLTGPNGRARPFAELLASRCVRDEETGCLNCSGYADKHFYPHIHYKGRPRRVNRAVWEEANGPIPHGMHVLHKCDNIRCAELDHLFLGTHQQNMDDKVAKGRQPRGRAVRCAKLTDDDARAIYADRRGREEIAADYGVSRAAVRQIHLGKSWRHATGASQDVRIVR